MDCNKQTQSWNWELVVGADMELACRLESDEAWARFYSS